MLTYEDRALTLDDTQGMFLLLAAGFLLAVIALSTEFFGGCFSLFQRKRQRSVSTIESNPRFHERQTPREWQFVECSTSSSNNIHVDIHLQNNADRTSTDSCVHNINSISYPKVEENNIDKDIDKVVEDDLGNKTNHEELNGNNKKDVDMLFENVFGEKFNHEEVDHENISTN